MQLSDRLQAVASMVTENSRLADVGTDHGYIPIYLCEMGKIPSAIAMDVKKGPLLRAKMNIERYHMQEKIRIRLSAGVLKLNPDEADSVVIAGMGGTLVMKILEEGKKVLVDVKELVLEFVDALEYNGQMYQAFFPAETEGENEDDPDNGLVILKVIHEDGEDLLSTLDSDEELEAVYEQFMELLFDEDEE